jgi:hypothetical protein
MYTKKNNNIINKKQRQQHQVMYVRRRLANTENWLPLLFTKLGRQKLGVHHDIKVYAITTVCHTVEYIARAYTHTHIEREAFYKKHPLINYNLSLYIERNILCDIF